MPQRKLTQAFCQTAGAVDGKRTIYWDAGLAGFGLIVQPSGHRSFCIQYRDEQGQDRRPVIDGRLPLAEARKQALEMLAARSRGVDPVKERRKAAEHAAGTLRAIAEVYFAREGRGLAPRSVAHRRSAFERLVYPAIGHLPVGDIGKARLTALLDDITDNAGPAMAKQVQTYLMRVLRWHADRVDDYSPPFMKRRPGGKSRDRVLDDAEIRALWRATEPPHPYHSLLRVLLLTAARRNEAARMTRSEIAGTDWILPGARHKTGNECIRPLSKAAQRVLANIPRLGDKWVFTTNGRVPLNGFPNLKKAFDRRSGIAAPWRVHDLRRTARSLMSRARVPNDFAEMCLGHELAGVRGVYDRWGYHHEKAEAFEKLAALVEHIAARPRQNVVPIRATRRGKVLQQDRRG
jgi:integrase